MPTESEIAQAVAMLQEELTRNAPAISAVLDQYLDRELDLLEGPALREHFRSYVARHGEDEYSEHVLVIAWFREPLGAGYHEWTEQARAEYRASLLEEAPGV